MIFLRFLITVALRTTDYSLFLNGHFCCSVAVKMSTISGIKNTFYLYFIDKCLIFINLEAVFFNCSTATQIPDKCAFA